MFIKWIAICIFKGWHCGYDTVTISCLGGNQSVQCEYTDMHKHNAEYVLTTVGVRLNFPFSLLVPYNTYSAIVSLRYSVYTQQIVNSAICTS